MGNLLPKDHVPHCSHIIQNPLPGRLLEFFCSSEVREAGTVEFAFLLYLKPTPPSIPVPGLLALCNFPRHLSGSSQRICLIYPLHGPLDPHFPFPAPPHLFLNPSSGTRQFVSYLSVKLLPMSVSSSRCIHLSSQGSRCCKQITSYVHETGLQSLNWIHLAATGNCALL